MLQHMKNILTAQASGNLEALKQARKLAQQAHGIKSEAKLTKASVSKEHQEQAKKNLDTLKKLEAKGALKRRHVLADE